MNSSQHSCARPGRPRALDDVKLREIIALITAGFSIERAARYVGCAPATIRRETIRNAKFNRDLRHASLNAELSPLQAIREAGRKYWRAAAWLLERMDPQRFGKQNVGHIKPEEVQAFLQVVWDVIHQDVANPDERDRILIKLDHLARAVERVAFIERDTPPQPRRRRRRPGQPSPEAQRLLAEINHPVDGEPTSNRRTAVGGNHSPIEQEAADVAGKNQSVEI
jgi:hypothetical protein